MSTFPPFHNEPYLNFAEETSQRRMKEALQHVGAELGRTYPVIIGGEKIESEHKSSSRNPARLTQIVGHVHDADPALVDQAVDAAWAAFPAWSALSPEVRARYLIKAAAVLRRRICEFAAWMVYECSKNWNEAYADVAEAIDFLEFYAREAERRSGVQPVTNFPGEENGVHFQPIGVGAIITPWNFPLAILVGMAMAPVAAGNTVVIKPAEQTPVIAARFVDLLQSIGLPTGVVNFLPGPGETVGEALTGHPRIRFISFTGSRDVGLRINSRAAAVVKGQRWIKRTILELGGKNATIVDDDVNLDAAAAGIVEAAFGFQGQKCSACSRVVAHTRIYDALLAKIVDRASRLTVGNPEDGHAHLGAVIDGDAYHRIISAIAIGRSEGRLLLGGEDSEDTNEAGYFVHPCVIADVKPSAKLAQEEIFGPVLAVMRAESFEQAVEIANDTDYGLTGGIYSYNREHLEYGRRAFHVGNLYLNRKCTGALVDVQPFGGFKLSGTNSKAGGRGYLDLFLESKSVCERW